MKKFITIVNVTYKVLFILSGIASLITGMYIAEECYKVTGKSFFRLLTEELCGKTD